MDNLKKAQKYLTKEWGDNGEIRLTNDGFVLFRNNRKVPIVKFLEDEDGVVMNQLRDVSRLNTTQKKDIKDDIDIVYAILNGVHNTTQDPLLLDIAMLEQVLEMKEN